MAAMHWSQSIFFISGSIQSARNAAGELKEEFPDAQVHVMDSQLATVLQGQLVEEAAELRDRGLTAAQQTIG